MPRKSKSFKGNKGKSQRVQCCSCNRLTPRDKCIRVEKFSMPIDNYLYDELKKGGAKIHVSSFHLYFCFACARHRKMIQL